MKYYYESNQVIRAKCSAVRTGAAVRGSEIECLAERRNPMDLRRFGKTMAFYLIPSVLSIVIPRLMVPALFEPTRAPLTHLFAFAITVIFGYLVFRTARVIRPIR